MRREEEPLRFLPVAITQKEDIEEILGRAGSLSCQYTFAGLYCLGGKYRTETAMRDGTLFIRQKRPPYPGNVYFPPVFPGLCSMNPGERQDRLSAGFQKILEAEKREALPGAAPNRPCLFGITEEFAEAMSRSLPEDYRLCEQRDWHEYLYSTKRMRDLPGSGLSAKRRDIRAFWREFEGRASVEPIGEQNLEEVVEFQRRWQAFYGAEREDAAQLWAEHEGILTGLSHYEELGFLGLLMRVDGRAAAYGYGIRTGSGVFDVMAQKADYTLPRTACQSAPSPRTCITGCPQGDTKCRNIGKAWFQQLAAALSGCGYMNYEEDIGLKGLRELKLSYKPDLLLKKYMAVPKA